MSNAPISATAEGLPEISRRGFLGHVAGAYVALAMASDIGVGASSLLDALIADHRAKMDAWDEWLEKTDVLPEDRGPTYPSDSIMELAAMRVEKEALAAICAYRPSSLKENERRMAYLLAGPWEGSLPIYTEVELLLTSFLPIGWTPA